ncbi:translation elongation factor Ts [Pseudobacteroides cellulosolvens]|uniref:Elongation factor Ts n=1 Tax=Pseudobacteroides cellulosolvens ATCC 35603 = DSM 2933 TaxID=398512 RepID=A0A0L6JW66_9FIRM|nr:translation elongation factor Ts [Pseudobacteroides cellulosolvens]KNY30106.1 Elongation factor Ts [Pseudobacteroides cellulosolvens ATCC 35603 = DSM 2933]
MITTEMVKQLRETTGAGIMECKNTLSRLGGDFEKAKTELKEKSEMKIETKAGRITSEGIVDSYIHGNGRIGVLVEVNIETDFAAMNTEFKSLVKDLGMQIAASNPQYIRREEIPSMVIDTVREDFRNQAVLTGKPEKLIDKIIEGQLEKYYKQICLMEQTFIKDNEKTVQDIVNEKIMLIGENITVRRFVRYEMGEGLVKKDENFSQEVLKQIGNKVNCLLTE